MYKILIFILALSGILFAQDDSMEESKYDLSAQFGLYYTQGYGNYVSDDINLGERKMDFSNAFVYVGFEGLEFNHLRFGANLLGSVKLSAGKTIDGTAYNSLGMGANAILYQAFVGFVSDYFSVSAGRENIDMEWITDFVEGVRLSGNTLDTTLNLYYFNRQAIADPNEIVAFEDNRVGHSFVASISNNSWEHLLFDVYFMSLNKRLWNLEAQPFNAVGFNAVFSVGSDIASDTTIKYTFFDSKDSLFSNAHYLQIEEAIVYSGIGVNVGIIKLFNDKNANQLAINVLGDQNPFEQGAQLYANNALTAYVGMNYNYDDLFGVAIIYGNTSNIRNAYDNAKETINELNVSAVVTWSGLEIGCIYSKVFGNKIESFIYGSQVGNKKLNRDYFEVMVAYNF